MVVAAVVATLVEPFRGSSGDAVELPVAVDGTCGSIPQPVAVAVA